MPGTSGRRYQDQLYEDPSRWLRLKSRFRAGGSESTLEDIDGVPRGVVGHLKEIGVGSIDAILKAMVRGLQRLLPWLDRSLATAIYEQAKEWSVGARFLGFLGEGVADHLIGGYERDLAAARV